MGDKNMRKMKTTVNLHIETFNESTKKMRALGIDSFSQYVDYVLREHADPLAIVAAKQKHYQRMLMHYTDIRNKIEEELQIIKREAA